MGFAPAPAAPAAGGQYRVGAAPESLYNIAAKTLGAGDRWWKIANLNPGYTDGLAQLPAGTTLRMPPEAVLPQN
jgi:hypothetical protein